MSDDQDEELYWLAKRIALQNGYDYHDPRTGEVTKASCPICNGNDRDAPCAYPSENRKGCLRDARLAHEALLKSGTLAAGHYDPRTSALTPIPQSRGPWLHDWVPSTLGHGEVMCKRCLTTNREAAVLGILNSCDVAPKADA